MDSVILIFLGVWTIRDIVAASGMVPDDIKFISSIVYGNHSKNILKRTLKDMGYSDKRSNRVIRDWSLIAKDSKMSDAPQLLISIIANHINKFDERVTYSKANPTKSYYYINTMSAIYDTKHDHISVLTNLFRNIIMGTAEKKIINTPDFIIAPKSGNPILAFHVAEKLDIPLLLIKDSDEESAARVNINKRSEIYFETNIEGSQELSNILNKNKKKKLNGILLDCNTSSGTQLATTAKKFNQVVQNLKLNINDLSDAFVLFVASDAEKSSAENRLNANNIKLHRFFDLDEEIKEQLFGLRYDNHYFDYYENKDDVDKLYEHMKFKNKIKFLE